MAEDKHHKLVDAILHDLRFKFALTQQDIADYCGLSQQAISAMANGGGARDSTYRKLRELYKKEQPLYAERIRRAAEALDRNFGSGEPEPVGRNRSDENRLSPSEVGRRARARRKNRKRKARA